MSSIHMAQLKRASHVNGELFRIASAATDSNEIDWRPAFGDAEAISIYAPAVLAETVQIQLDPGDGTFRTLVDSSNAAIAGPTAGNVQVYNGAITACSKMRLHATGAAAADRDFLVWKAFRA